MTSEVVARQEAPELTSFEIIERVITQGDLSKMSPSDRVAFYWRTCESLGLNPLTRPFEYLNLNGRTILYARKDATDQLRSVNDVSVTSMARERDEANGLEIVRCRVRLPDGREDEATGVVNILGLKGDALANAIMKAETKAKRRATLSICGLGFLDETEVDGGERLDVDLSTGEIVERKPATLLEQVQRQTETYVTDATVDLETGEVLSEPMTVDESAELPIEDAELSELIERNAAAGGLTIQELADLARAAGFGKQKFASALEVVPADVGKRIEEMTDSDRYALAVRMGLTS